MYGTIIGDIIGSPYEFDRGTQRKDFELFTGESYFTDDTVMCAAVAEALIHGDVSEDGFMKSIIKWGQKYPDAGYGGRFYQWLYSDDHRPYGSFGNGSAMRVSPIGLFYDDVDVARAVARNSSAITHNHPEGIKGAESVVTAMILLRHGLTKESVRRYIISEFGYNLEYSVEQLRPLHKHIETCMDSVPKAFAAFFDGDSFEDVIRNAVSLGGDTDTIAAIAGGLAEAYYDIPIWLISQAKDRLDDNIREIVSEFYRRCS